MKALNDRNAAPIKRLGGKGRNARYLIPHFAKASVWIEPFFGSGAVFFQLPRGVYSRAIVNDLHASLVNFFRVLRERPAELSRVCALTPYAQDEFVQALEHSDDALEEARRFWVRSRFSFGAQDPRTPGNWARVNPEHDVWVSDGAYASIEYLERYAHSLRDAHILNQDAVEVVDYYGRGDCFIYCDPPYVPATRTSTGMYAHEMTIEQHMLLLESVCGAVQRGARVALSGYDNDLYNSALSSWRRVEKQVAFAMRTDEMRKSSHRTEILWCSYPAELELQNTTIAPTAKPKSDLERMLLSQARHGR